jgi:hypothetical protein
MILVHSYSKPLYNDFNPLLHKAENGWKMIFIPTKTENGGENVAASSQQPLASRYVT